MKHPCDFAFETTMLWQPTHSVAVDGVRIYRFADLAGDAVHGIKKFLRIEEDCPKVLLPTIQLQPEWQQSLCIQLRAADDTVLTVQQGVIDMEHCGNRRIVRLCTKPKPAGNMLVILKTSKCRSIQQIIKAAQGLHISVEVNAAMLLHDQQTQVISQEGKLALLVTHLCVGIVVDIEVVFVPLDDLIVRHVLVPAGNALLRKPRLGASAKPAVVDFLGDHGFTFFNADYY